MRISVSHQRRQIGGNLPHFRGYRQDGGFLPGLALGAYLLHRRSQQGGELAVFRGAREYQYGRGIGNILRSVGKVMGPLARRYGPSVLKIGKKFVKHAIRAREQGATWGEAAREGLGPAAKSAMKELSNAVSPPDTLQDPHFEGGDNELVQKAKQAGNGILIRQRMRRHQRGAGGGGGHGPSRMVFKQLTRSDRSGRPTHYNF
jgi:hypothetical protein